MNGGILALALTNKSLGLELEYRPAPTRTVGDGMDELPLNGSRAYSPYGPAVSPEFTCLLQSISEERAELR
jgi:hypothetical protein